jgi:hypothetical protein
VGGAACLHDTTGGLSALQGPGYRAVRPEAAPSLLLLDGMVIQVLLVAGDSAADKITVATTIEVDTDDPRWPTRLVDNVTSQAQEGALRLREHLAPQLALPGDSFVPLASVLRCVH